MGVSSSSHNKWRRELPNPKNNARLDRVPTWHILMIILFIAFVLRLILVFQPEVIHNDGIEYIRHAKEVLTGNWTGGESSPLYPTLIAMAYSFTENFELAGIWVSVIFGTLLVIPVFYLGKEIFSKGVGGISGLVVAVHPVLHSASGSVLTESTYHFFIATSVLFGWLAFHKGKFYSILLFSLFVSLAFLTKPEAIGFLLIFSAWVLFFNPPKRKRYWVRRTVMILVAIFAFFAFSSPYLIRLREETGKWSISKKVNVTIGSFSEMENITSLDESPFDREGLSLLSFIKDPLSQWVRVGTGLLKSFYTFQQAFNPLLSFFAVIGWIGIIRNRSWYSLKANFYILTYHFFFFGFVFSIFFISKRYTSQMVSISIPWAAFGFYMFLEWVHQRWDFFKKKEIFIKILVVLLLMALFVQGRVIRPREHRIIQKEVGLWMKDHLPRGMKIMSRRPQEAFYAELPWLKIHQENVEEILREGRSNGVKYLIIDEGIEKDLPDLWEKTEDKDLILLKEFQKKNQRLVLFEMVYPE